MLKKYNVNININVEEVIGENEDEVVEEIEEIVSRINFPTDILPVDFEICAEEIEE